jgi:RNA polymerase sigma-70 factor (ECF subfamily)
VYKRQDRYSGLVAGAIAAQGVASSDVEDLTQQTFVNAYKGLAGFRGEAKLSSWLFRIALNTARGYLKRNAQRPAVDSIEQQAESGMLATAPDGADSTREVHQRRALETALGQLIAPQRLCLSLYYFEELSYEEIAEASGMNLNTVRTHIRRGKLRLAELLDESLLDGDN